MKKYIKITDEVTEEIAVKHLESLWGKVYLNLMKWQLVKSNSNKIIVLDDLNDIYYTHYTGNKLKQFWYEEIIPETFEAGEQVACSDISKEKAIKDLDREYDKYYYTWWKIRNWKYIIEYGNWTVGFFNHIAKIPKVETITIWGIKYNKQEYEKAIANLKPIK